MRKFKFLTKFEIQEYSILEGGEGVMGFTDKI